MGNLWPKSSKTKEILTKVEVVYSLEDPLPEPGTKPLSEVNPYEKFGNGWENYREQVINAIPDSLLTEAMDRTKRLRFRARMCATDLPITVDAHIDQTVAQLKSALLNNSGFESFPRKMKIRLFKNGESDSGIDENFDGRRLQEINIRSGDYILFGLHFVPEETNIDCNANTNEKL